MITYFVSLISKFITFVSFIFKIDRINYDERRLYSDEKNKEEQNEEVAAKSERPQIPQTIIVKKGEPMETNINSAETEKSMTPLESALENALLFGENMYFSAMATNTSHTLSDPAKAPPNLTPEAYAAFCEYTAELFAVAAAARQELNDISA